MLDKIKKWKPLSKKPVSTTTKVSSGFTFYTDEPLNNIDDDKFHHAAFAKRIAETIVSHNDFTSKSIVYGVYGRWGEGKTTTLEFMERFIKGDDRFVVLKFNPWRIGSEDQILRWFFHEVSLKLERELSEKYKKKIGKLLKIISGLSESVAFLGVLKPLKPLIDYTADEFSREHTLEELKAEVGKILKADKKRIVILIDDIDRLSDNEIVTIFRIVKLIADFDYTSYILALDEEIVSQALGKYYSASKNSDKHVFIEKIILVPLSLPKPSRADIDIYMMDLLGEAFKRIGVEFSTDESSSFNYLYRKAISTKIETPRAAKRYVNALLFAIPTIKDEVNLFDLVIIEAVRIFYPRLYDLIKTNKVSIIHGVDPTRENRLEEGIHSAYERFISLVDKLSVDSEETSRMNLIVKQIFPQLGSNRLTRDDNDGLRKHKRIGSEFHFDRYFHYGLRYEEIPDTDIIAILHLAGEIQPLEVETKIRLMLMNNQFASEFVAKIRANIESLNSNGARNFALALSRVSDKLAQSENQNLGYYAPYAFAEDLVFNILGKIENRDHRLETARLILQNSLSPYFARGVFVEIYHQHPNETLFLPDEVNALSEVITTRIREYFLRDNIDLINETNRFLPSILMLWSGLGTKAEVWEYTQHQLESNPAISLHLLRYFITNRGNRVIFGGENYDNLAKIVEPSILLQSLRQYLPVLIENIDLENYTVPFEQRAARRFYDAYMQEQSQEIPPPQIPEE